MLTLGNLTGSDGLLEAEEEQPRESHFREVRRRDEQGEGESWDGSMTVRDESVDESSESGTSEVDGPGVSGSTKRGILCDVFDETKRHGAINVTAASGGAQRNQIQLYKGKR